MHHVGVALVHVFAVLLAELDGGDLRGAGHALGGAQHLIKFVKAEVPALHIAHAVQCDDKGQDVDVVLLFQFGGGCRRRNRSEWRSFA